MTHGLASLASQADWDAVQAGLVELALGGAIAPALDLRGWLESLAIARPADGDTVIADEDWLACALPSASAEELLLRTLLRDSSYRLHVDVSLAEIIAAIGASGRWSRLEELVFGDLAVMTPRLAALTALAKADDQSFGSACWRCLDPLSVEIASPLDQRCWGLPGTPEELFPILRTRYPAFVAVPVFIEPSSPLAAMIISAASLGEGVRVSGEQQGELLSLARQGVPVWWQPLADGRIEAALSLPCRARGRLDALSSHTYSRGVPAYVRERSALLPSGAGFSRASFWEIVEQGTEGLAFVGASSRNNWPSDEDRALRGLPSGEHLADLVRARQATRAASDPADDALRMLADHSLYGFWIQTLLIEALDRELGEETLLFAPPHAMVKDVESATRVYYRPRLDAAKRVRPLLELGTLDDVMSRVATSVSVRPVATLGDPGGPWAMSLGLLARVGIAQTRHDRWALSPHALDRLHGGGLMTGVIRRGKGFRERLHEVLEGLWRERAEAAGEARSA